MCEDQAPMLTATEVAELLCGALEHGEGVEVTSLMDPATAKETDVAYFSDDKVADYQDCKAGLLLVSENAVIEERACVRVENPALAAAFLQQHFHPCRAANPGIHATAIVEEGAFVDASAEVGPWCVIHDGATIGANSILGAGVVVGEDSEIGDDCLIHERVVLYPEVYIADDCVIHAGTVIGVEGFGYVWSGSAHEAMPQIGTVEIGEGCEIGANCVIDRATFGVTKIGNGCIIDNLVQIGHNCQLGDFVVLCGQAGLAGSSTLETGAVMGGQAGAGGHITIGAGAQVGGGAKVFSNIAPGAKVAGNPAIDYMKHMRAAAKRRKGN